MKIGILGGGQLGQMLTQAAIPLGVSVSQLDPNPLAPCHVYSGCTIGDVISTSEVLEWGQQFDVVTYEWERVSLQGLKALESSGVMVHPSSSVLETIQDKGIQKQFFIDSNIPTAPYQLWSPGDEITMNFPCIQKARTGGYDGKGVQKVDTPEALWPVPSVLESLVDIKEEYAIIIARGTDGAIQLYDPVSMQFDPKANLVRSLQMATDIADEHRQQLQQLAIRLAEKLQYVGVLAVETFLTKMGEILVNELAPRPHNSGHHTIEGTETSQFENHIRAISSLPLGETSTMAPAVGMVNLVAKTASIPEVSVIQKTFSLSGAYLHWYGKSSAKPARKMGHVTLLASSSEMLKEMQQMVTLLAEQSGL